MGFNDCLMKGKKWMDHDKRIDKSVKLVAVNIAILTVSDSRKSH